MTGSSAEISNRINFHGENKNGTQIGHISGVANIFHGPGLPAFRFPFAENAYFRTHEGDSMVPVCDQNTRVEILQVIKRWIDGGQEHVLWLTGSEGTGKTRIAGSIAREYDKKHDTSSLMASFLFSQEQEEASKFVTTIAGLLARRNKRFKSLLEDIWRQNHEQLESLEYLPMMDQWQCLVLDILARMESDDGILLLIVIDALDMCPREDRDHTCMQQVLKIISDTPQNEHVRIRFLITSRPTDKIMIDTPFQLMSLADVPVDEDIRTYLKSNLGSLISDEQQLEALVAITGGFFVCADALCRHIKEDVASLLREEQLQAILDSKTSPSVKDHLDRIYSTIIKECVGSVPVPSPETLKKRSDLSAQTKASNITEGVRVQVKWLLGEIVLLFTPLSLSAVNELLGKGLRGTTIEAVIKSFHGVFHLPKDESSPLRIHHSAFADFLFDESRSGSLDFHVKCKEAHKKMAKHCIELMQRNLRKEIRQYATLSDSASDGNRSLISPALAYACRYWVQHLAKSGEMEIESVNVLHFLREYFIHWLAIMGILKDTREVWKGIVHLQSSRSPRVLLFVRETIRFFHKNQWLAENIPLQLFSSGVMFCPKRSVLKRIASGTDQSNIYDIRGVDKTWCANIQTLEGHKKPVYSISVSLGPENHLIASGSEDKSINLWDARTGQLCLSLRGHAATVKTVALSPDGKVVASGSDDKTIKLWDSNTGSLLHTITVDDHPDEVHSVAFLPDRSSRLLASGYRNGAIKVWDCGKGDWGDEEWTIGIPLCLQGVSDSVSCVVFSPYANNRILASASSDGVIRFWNFGQGGSARKGELVRMFKAESTMVTSIAFSPDPKHQLLVSASNLGSIKIWDFNHRTDTTYACLEGHANWANCVTFLSDPKSQTVASGSRDGKITIWDYGKKLHRTFNGHAKNVQCVLFSETPSGPRLISSSHDLTIKIWDLEAMDLHQPTRKPYGKISYLAFSPDGQHLASYSTHENHNRTVNIWNTSTGEVHRVIEEYLDKVQCIAFQSATDKQVIASGSRDKSIKLWDYNTGDPLHTIEINSRGDKGVTCLTFSPDGHLLASASGHEIVCLWDACTYRPIPGFSSGQWRNKHRGQISVLVFAPNSRLLASASVDKTIKLWDCHSGTLVHNLTGHADRILSIGFSPDSQMLASASRDGAMKVWSFADQGSTPFAKYGSSITYVAFSPDGKWLASSRSNGDTIIWKTESIMHSVEPHRILERHSRFVWSADSLLISVQDPGWLCFEGERMLWIPSEYRHGRLATNLHGLVAISDSHGRLCLISMEQVRQHKRPNFMKEGDTWL